MFGYPYHKGQIRYEVSLRQVIGDGARTARYEREFDSSLPVGAALRCAALRHAH